MYRTQTKGRKQIQIVCSTSGVAALLAVNTDPQITKLAAVAAITGSVHQRSLGWKNNHAESVIPATARTRALRVMVSRNALSA